MAVSDLCSVPGILKLIQSLLIFIALMLHRHGDNGNYLFLSTTALKLGNTDPNIDAENLGNSTLVTFMVVNLVLILGYILDGRYEVHNSLLEPSLNALAFCMFIGTGAVTILTWQGEEMVDTSAGLTETEFSRNVTAALALAGICIITGGLYLVDTVYYCFTRNKDDEQYENP